MEREVCESVFVWGVCVCVRVNARYVRAEVCVHEHVVCLGLANHTTSWLMIVLWFVLYVLTKDPLN